MEKESFLESIKKGLWTMPSGERMTTVQYLTKWVKYWFSLLFNRKQRKLEEERERERQRIERRKAMTYLDGRFIVNSGGEEEEFHPRKVYRKKNY